MDVEPQIQRECTVEGTMKLERPICYTWIVNYAEDWGPKPLQCSRINCIVKMSVLPKLNNQSNPRRFVFIGNCKLFLKSIQKLMAKIVLKKIEG